MNQHKSLPYSEEEKDRNMIKKLIYNSVVHPVPASGINDGDNDTEVEMELPSVR
jgi:hypothetical protein